MATVIDELIIAIGLDPSKVKEGIGQIGDVLGSVNDVVKEFGEGLSEGLSGAENSLAETKAAAAGTGEAVAEVKAEAEGASQALQKSGEAGQASMAKVGAGAKGAARQVDALGSRVEAVGRRIGATMRRAALGFAATIAAPLLGAVALTNMVKRYTEGLERLEELNKKSNLTLKEKKERQELLQKYTEKDIKQYREVTAALDKVKAQVEKLATALVGGLFTALMKTSGFIKDHWVAFLPLAAAAFAVLAKVLVVTVIPALWAFTAALLANPITWLIGLLVILGLMLEDLWTYINGGESALEGLWSAFGSGEEIAEKLKAAWEDLKLAGTQLWTDIQTGADALWKALQAGAEVFFKYFGAAWENLKKIGEDAMIALGALITGDFGTLGEKIKEIFVGVGKFIFDTLTGYFTAVKDFVLNIFEAIGGIIKNTIKAALDLLPDWLTGDVSVGDVAIPRVGAEDGGIMSASAAVSPGAAAGTTIDQSTKTEMGGVNIKVDASPEAKAIAAAVQGEMAKLVSNNNRSTANP